jgi:hypothetical protein
LKLQDGHLLPSTTNCGDSFFQKEIQSIGLSKFLNLLYEGNRVWAQDAAALVVVISRKTFEYNGRSPITHQFDAGAAWENLALEASIRGIVAHGIEGFDYDRTRRDLAIPDTLMLWQRSRLAKKDQERSFHQSFKRRNFQMIESPYQKL